MAIKRYKQTFKITTYFSAENMGEARKKRDRLFSELFDKSKIEGYPEDKIVSSIDPAAKMRDPEELIF